MSLFLHFGAMWGPQIGPEMDQTNHSKICIRPKPLGTNFGAVFGGPGPSKLRFSCERYCIFCDFAFFNPDPIWDPMLDPPGLSFGSALAPKIAETCLEIPLGAPKSLSKDLFPGPGGPQGRSKRFPRGLQAAKTAPRALQEASGSI